MLAAHHMNFFEVLAARKTYLITARARKNKRTVRMLASARKDHSIPLQLYFSYFHVSRFLALSVILTSLIYPLVAVVFGHLRNGQCLACVHPIRDARG